MELMLTFFIFIGPVLSGNAAAVISEKGLQCNPLGQLCPVIEGPVKVLVFCH